jgi:hypothetical protein
MRPSKQLKYSWRAAACCCLEGAGNTEIIVLAQAAAALRHTKSFSCVISYKALLIVQAQQHTPDVAAVTSHHWLSVSACPNSSEDSSTDAHCRVVIINANTNAPCCCSTWLMHTCNT